MTLLTSPRPRTPRRGVTLVEMLVAVALLVLMMSVIVQVFSAATSAVSASRAYQELDQSLRQLDATIRTDLSGVTARLTPPLDPKDNLGYFEYGENSFADLQGEDCDDYLRFTVKAPEGHLFNGRMWPNTDLPTGIAPSAALLIKPITISSQYAEVIYFLRNGNLYRRVLLVAPEKQAAVMAGNWQVPTALGGNGYYNSGATVSWLAVNDLSAHPAPVATLDFVNIVANGGSVGLIMPSILNTLGDLTNRENRAFYQRFYSDYTDSTGIGPPDTKPDDVNGDTVPDLWPSLYAGLFNPGTGVGIPPLVNEVAPTSAPRMRPFLSDLNKGMLAFPYVYPGAYSMPDTSSATLGLGWIHSPDPGRSQLNLVGLNSLNHNPLDVGDSLPAPLPLDPNNPTKIQTWWGFPTWRETIHPLWLDPITSLINTGGAQPNGLGWLDPSVLPPSFTGSNGVASWLPPMTTDVIPGTTTPIRLVPQLFTDRVGTVQFASVALQGGYPAAQPDFLWKQSWEDDLIMTGVRSFDVKAYDNTYGGYVDLGWGSDLRQYVPYTQTGVLKAVTQPNFLFGTPFYTDAALNVHDKPFLWPPVVNDSVWPPDPFSTYTMGYNAGFNLISQTYAHEGRIPPLVNDRRPDYQFPLLTPNLGDDNANVVRLRRVWDTWSTDYSNAPATGTNPVTCQPMGPPFGPPIYPSYPPPYPMPLRGIQIQIRVVDPRNEHVKVLTIRQDFSDKL
jgi:prepilin-type N-terminal cleavage/methylation domain-containing protein